ncbi:DUF1850 domain-containing protein [Salibacterium sp. K-3]
MRNRMLWKNNKKEIIILAFIIILTAMGIVAACESEERQLVIQHEREGESFIKIPIQTGDEVALSWIHSVEQTPWTDIFRVEESCDFMLEETRFESFGAGVEHKYEDVEQKDGTFVAKNMEECHNSVNWIHSHKAAYEVKVNQEVVAETSDLPHHAPLKILIEKR